MEEQPDSWGRFGYLHIRKGKTAFRRRNLPIAKRVREILATWIKRSKSDLVFAGADEEGPRSNFSLIHQQAAMRTLLKLPEDAVNHSSRHTALTNLGLAGADIFSLQQAAGHASIQTTRKDVHPIQESISAAFQKRRRRNQRSLRSRLQK
jgi:integrase